MNTVFRNWCRALMNKRRVLVVAEMLCLIAVASVFLIASPLALAKKNAAGGCDCPPGCACAQAACAQAACAQVAAQKKKAPVPVQAAAAQKKKVAPAKAATFVSILTNVSKTSPTTLTAQLFNHITLATLKKDSWAWVTVTLNVKGKTETFGAEAFLNSRNRPVVLLAEILPTSSSVANADPRPLAELLKDPNLLALIKSGNQIPLIGIN